MNYPAQAQGSLARSHKAFWSIYYKSAIAVL